MKTLEDKILKKVYLYETKKTLLEILTKLFIVVVLSLAVYLFGSSLVKTLIEQRSFDFFEILFEDMEVIKKFLWDSIYVFYMETPKLLLTILIIGTIGLILAFVKIIVNFDKVKNKVLSIVRFWQRR